MIKEIIKKRGYLLFDGAFGTYYATTYETNESCELANIKHPKRVLDIHKEYIDAGCDAIKTNTFGANMQNLDCSMEQIIEIMEAGYKLASQAVQGTTCEVFADIGPFFEQKNVVSLQQMREVVDVFVKVGAKNFLFETYGSDQGLVQIAEYIKSKVKDAQVITSFAVSADGYTSKGIAGQKLLQNMKACKDIDGYGFNCVCGPMHLRRVLQQMEIQAGDPILIMPNAGYPTIVHNRMYFPENCMYYVNEMKKIVEHGALMIGGCCGTTPAHIKAIRQVLGMYKTPTYTRAHAGEPTKAHVIHNELYQKMEKHEPVIAVEFDPPVNSDIRKFMESAEFLRDAGIDAITIADCPIARARVDSSLLATKIRRELGIQVIPHMTCRDRNLNATKALLYGLEMEDVHNVLVVTGDPIPAADRHEVKAVFNFNSQILAGYITDLNERILPEPFLIYGALNVNAVNFEHELIKARGKIERGVKVFLTQPILSNRAFENLKIAKEQLNIKILGGIIPIVSHRNAIFMNNEIAGIDIERNYIDAYNNTTREEASKLAVSISCDIVDRIRDYVDGYYLMTPFHRVEIIHQIVTHIQAMDKSNTHCYNIGINRR